KAYDRVRWDFVEASLNAVGIPSLLLGLRFHAGISLEEWSLIQLSRTGPNLSHLFFVDNLVIFSQANSFYSSLLKNFLSKFCELSGLKSTLVPKGICDSIEELARQFIWGAMDGKRKIALNKAFMLKLGYSLITKTEALWIQIFKAKYCLVKSMPDSIMRNRCSYIWKAVAKVWPLLHSNMIWSIRNRRSVRCWEDNWVPNVRPLNQYVSGHGNIVPESKIKDMVLVNGDWNLDLFRLWLPEEVVKQIISISPPLDSARPNILSWSRSTTGVFSVKSAYYMLKEEYWNPKDFVHSVSGFSAAGGVIRDGKGKWILGYNHFLEKCSVAVAKLW
ncbi:hypothetical protein Goarm_006508, partial [Gossypium armourianum]|nr:hypothetical protein [Gossypium armourianum]